MAMVLLQAPPPDSSCYKLRYFNCRCCLGLTEASYNMHYTSCNVFLISLTFALVFKTNPRIVLTVNKFQVGNFYCRLLSTKKIQNALPLRADMTTESVVKNGICGSADLDPDFTADPLSQVDPIRTALRSFGYPKP
jgi:hypothetical protein